MNEFEEKIIQEKIIKQIKTPKMQPLLERAGYIKKSDIENIVRIHYQVYGYEKQHCLKEALEELLNTKFKVD